EMLSLMTNARDLEPKTNGDDVEGHIMERENNLVIKELLNKEQQEAQ
ncbi:hypothetical protein AVEN_232353-1, partial [Araneus ventricosus]